MRPALSILSVIPFTIPDTIRNGIRHVHWLTSAQPNRRRSSRCVPQALDLTVLIDGASEEQSRTVQPARTDHSPDSFLRFKHRSRPCHGLRIGLHHRQVATGRKSLFVALVWRFLASNPCAVRKRLRFEPVQGIRMTWPASIECSALIAAGINGRRSASLFVGAHKTMTEICLVVKFC